MKTHWTIIMTKHGILLWQTAKALLKSLKMSKKKESIFWDLTHCGKKLNKVNMKARKIESKLVCRSHSEEQPEMPLWVLIIRILKTLLRVKSILRIRKLNIKGRILNCKRKLIKRKFKMKKMMMMRILKIKIINQKMILILKNIKRIINWIVFQTLQIMQGKIIWKYKIWKF